MSSAAAELLASILGDTPAIPATSAIREERRGIEPDPDRCDPLRFVATPPQPSQPIAAESRRADRPESEAGRDLSQKSQESQGLVLRLAEARQATFMRRGYAEEAARALVQRLEQRDADSDDRALCLECSELRSNGQCAAASRSLLSWADKRLEPVQTVLQRCERFKPNDRSPK